MNQKRLVVCCDGTWNDADSSAEFTNVVRIARAIKPMFELAKQTNVAVHFNVDDHIEWDERPDLWNWYDPAKTGYNPDNRKNVEWYDWQELQTSEDTSPPRGFHRSRLTCATTARPYRKK